MKKQFNGCASTAATEMAIGHPGDRRGTIFGSLAFSEVIPRGTRLYLPAERIQKKERPCHPVRHG